MRPARFLLADPRRDLVAVELGQHDVEQDQVGRLGTPQPESISTIPGDDDVIPLLLERVLQESLDVWIVIDDEDLCRHRSSTRGMHRVPGSPTATPAPRL
jgi:hypothetical protein